MSDGWQDTREVAEARLGTTAVGRASKWRLVQLIGLGGSAWVYVGVDEKGGRAAIKVLHSPLLGAKQVVQRFVREALVANAIQHRGVVRVLDDGLLEGRVPFLALELLRGETVEERRDRKGGILPLDEVLWIADQVLSILDKAHAKEILHRDIKPENIFITDDRSLKLLDFGIARLGQRLRTAPDEFVDRQSIAELPSLPRLARGSEPPPSSSEVTKAGVALGTLDYMPPEQARGDWSQVSVQTDLWAVGATMFNLLSGRTVHDEPDFLAQMRAVTNRPATPLAQVAPFVPRIVCDLVDFALAFAAPGRWKTARTMRIALWTAYRELLANDCAGEGEGVTEIPRPAMNVRPIAPPVSIVEIDGD